MARHHLIEHHPEGPPVYTGAVGLVVNDLGSDVLRGSTEGSGGAARRDPNLAQTEVGNLDVAVRVEQKILQLEIPATKEILQK